MIHALMPTQRQREPRQELTKKGSSRWWAGASRLGVRGLGHGVLGSNFCQWDFGLSCLNVLICQMERMVFTFQRVRMG